jgi:hypothetical protein
MAARHPHLRRRRSRRRLQPHRAPSVVWGPSTAARGSGAAPGAPPPWGSPSPAANNRPAAGGRRTPANRGRRDNTKQGGGREELWCTPRSAGGGHRRPASRPPPAPATPASPPGTLHRAYEGWLRVRGNPNRTPSPPFYSMLPGPAGPTKPRGPLTGRPTHRR